MRYTAEIGYIFVPNGTNKISRKVLNEFSFRLDANEKLGQAEMEQAVI